MTGAYASLTAVVADLITVADEYSIGVVLTVGFAIALVGLVVRRIRK